MSKWFLPAFLLLCCLAAAAQQTMTNDDVIKMAKAGLSDTLIIAKINASPGSYDTSVNGMSTLKASGVSDAVVVAVIDRAQAQAARPAYASAAPDSDDPMAPHDAGVYLMTAAADGKPKMVFIDEAGESSERVSDAAGAAFSFGIAKVKMKADIPGPRAAVRTAQPRPVFYFYFPSLSSLGGFGGTDMITSPNQFALLALESRKDQRETTIGTANLASASVGADEKMSIGFDSERIRSGTYKITPKQDLKPGEYAFIATTRGVQRETGVRVVIYDFGVDAP